MRAEDYIDCRLRHHAACRLISRHCFITPPRYAHALLLMTPRDGLLVTPPPRLPFSICAGRSLAPPLLPAAILLLSVCLLPVAFFADRRQRAHHLDAAIAELHYAAITPDTPFSASRHAASRR
jgi:hypothetical protein